MAPVLKLRDGESGHQALSALFDRNRSQGYPDALTAQRQQTNHRGQRMAVEFAGIAVKVLADRLTEGTGGASLRRLRSNRYSSLDSRLVGVMPTSRQHQHEDNTGEPPANHFLFHHHQRYSLQCGLPQYAGVCSNHGAHDP